MTISRRTINTLLAGAPLAAALPGAAQPRRRDAVVLGMTLEPQPGLDPTSAAAAAIGEIVHYNVLEGLTKIEMNGAVTPLLAQSWTVSPDGRAWTFALKRGVTFSDGAPFDAAAVKFSFDRARAPGSTNKAKKAVFDNVTSVVAEDPSTVVLVLANPDASLPFRLGENTAVILHPNTAAQAATRPVGTGPYTLESWNKGASLTLAKWPGQRNAAKAAMARATFRFINDPAAQVAALLAGDVDAIPRFAALPSLAQFRADPRFAVEVGATAGKGIVAINHRRAPLSDVRVRRAIAHAIDRQAFIDGAQEGLGRPIGSHFAPTDAGYVDLTGVYPHDVARANALLREAGVATPLKLTLTLPPPAYARKGGEIVAAQLAAVGIDARIENVEWAQWLSGAFKGNFDLTIINHVEPLDYATAYANPGYYLGYDSAKFRALVAAHAESGDAREKARLWGEIQRQLAADAAAAYVWNPAQVAVFRRGLVGVWNSSPIFANDLAALAWTAPRRG